MYMNRRRRESLGQSDTSNDYLLGIHRNQPKMTAKTTRRSFTVEEKIGMVKRVKEECAGNLSEGKRLLGIDRKTLRRWLDNEEKMEEANHTKTFKTKRRLVGAGRRPKVPALEKELFDFFKDQEQEEITYRNIKEQAIRIKLQMDIDDEVLKFSDKWIFNFCQRHGLNTRRTRQDYQHDDRFDTAEKKDEETASIANTIVETVASDRIGNNDGELLSSDRLIENNGRECVSSDKMIENNAREFVSSDKLIENLAREIVTDERYSSVHSQALQLIK